MMMRVKRKKHGAERLDACADIVVEDIAAAEGNPANLFASVAPVRIEIGCGKGDFIVGTAAKEPNVNFLAIERVSDVLVTAAEKVRDAGLTNVKVCCADAKNLAEVFGEHTVDRIYLNFSDPWPKARHYKRRLTYRDFLAIYEKILVDGGKIYFKTDNRGLFDFSLEEFSEAGWTTEKVTFDLHNSEYNEGNVMTEYERRFSGMGTPINRLEAHK